MNFKQKLSERKRFLRCDVLPKKRCEGGELAAFHVDFQYVDVSVACGVAIIAREAVEGFADEEKGETYRLFA